MPGMTDPSGKQFFWVSKREQGEPDDIFAYIHIMISLSDLILSQNIRWYYSYIYVYNIHHILRETFEFHKSKHPIWMILSGFEFPISNTFGGLSCQQFICELRKLIQAEHTDGKGNYLEVIILRHMVMGQKHGTSGTLKYWIIMDVDSKKNMVIMGFHPSP